MSETAWRAPVVASVLTATKRIVGRLAASAIASASAASFFSRLTNGLTYVAGSANFMPGVTDGLDPMMGAPAGLHGDDATWLPGKKAETCSRVSFLRRLRFHPLERRALKRPL